VLAALVALMLAVPGGAFAQVALSSANDGARPLRDGIRLEATRLANARLPQPATLATQRERSWPGQHPVFLGALIGLGTGLVLSARSECRKSSDYTCGQYAGVLGGMGAGIGAGVGGVVGIFLR
jgi:hypothetical protein